MTSKPLPPPPGSPTAPRPPSPPQIASTAEELRASLPPFPIPPCPIPPPPSLTAPPSTPAVDAFVADCPPPGRDPKTGQFTVGNPGGRRGPNKATVWVNALLEAGIEELGRSVLVAIRRGDVGAMRLALDRVAPVRRGAHVDIPNFPDLKSAADVPAAHAAIIRAVTDGLVTAEEAKPISDLLANFTNSIDAATFAARLDDLERRLDEAKSRGPR